MPAPRPAHRADTLILAILAALPALLALSAFGVVLSNDSPTYLDYAAQLRAAALPRGEALLDSGHAPATLFRTIGYPAVLAGLQSLAPENWPALLVALQIVAQAGVVAMAHRVGLALGLSRRAAFATALAPAFGFTVVVQISVLTDALYGTLFTLAALLLLRAGLAGGRLRAVAGAGLLLGAATTIREATPFLAIGLLPAALVAAPAGRRIAGAALLLVPVLLVAGAILAHNQARSGHAVLSTSRQIVMIQATLPPLKRGVPVFDGDDPFDTAARRWVVPQGYDGIDPMLSELYREHGLTSPELAALASDRYWRAWRRHPVEMLRGMMVRFPNKMLQLPFQPVDTLAELHRHSGRPRPDFSRLDLQMRLARSGSVEAVFWLLATSITRAIGMLLSMAAILSPLLLFRAGDARRWPILGMWLACGAFLGVYLPVHIETRYLVPIVPLLALMGTVSLGVAWRRWRRAAREPAPPLAVS